MFWKFKKSRPAESQKEPLFTAIRGDDPDMRRAHGLAAASLDEFIRHVHRDGGQTCAAKLRFRDPELSARLGEDRFVYLWLASVQHDQSARLFSGAFFEVPKELSQWHQPGQRLQFEGEDIFDWFVNDKGDLHGGFTMRVARARLPEAERADFDKHVGVKYWVRAEVN